MTWPTDTWKALAVPATIAGITLCAICDHTGIAVALVVLAFLEVIA